jgi:hypothetical protein
MSGRSGGGEGGGGGGGVGDGYDEGENEWFRLVWKLARQSRSGVSDGDPWYSVVCEL